MPGLPRTLTSAALVCATVIAAVGCSRSYYRNSADREVYRIVEAKSSQVPGMPGGFTIEQAAQDVLASLPVVPQPPAPPAEGGEAGPTPESVPTVEAEMEPGAALISLEKALEIATLNSRDYQTQKETLYQAVLSLTFQRYQFAPHFFGILSADWDYTGSSDDQEVSAGSDFGFSWLFATGALLTTSLTTSVSEFLTGSPRKAASSLFSATITQPLLQGAGVAVREPLTQAERDVIYQMRSFVRFRRTFFVRVLSDYYRVVQQLQVVENERQNYQNLLTALDRASWLGNAGRMADFEVDQIRQDVLRAENGYVQARQAYRTALDQFKITLALPTETHIALDPKELERLHTEGILQIDLPPERIEQIAMEHRLDLMTQRDGVDDAARGVKVAENDLLPGLDLSASVDSSTENNEVLDFSSDLTNASVGVELDLPLDKLGERNDYRRSLIAYERAKRDYSLLRDEVVQDVRDDWREYTTNRRTYDIQQESVRLAERRVESTMLLLEAGRVTVRDVLDSREALLGAQNSRAQALVSYKVATLALARDMDILEVGEKGQLEEVFDEYK